MSEPYDYTQEDHIREVERALMYIEEAGHKCEQIAAALAKQGAEQRLLDGLRTAARALRAEHNRLLNTSHFPVPELPARPGQVEERPEQESLEVPPVADQQRMAL